MFTHLFQLPEVFYIVQVQVATVWTSPTSPRSIDNEATANPTAIRSWLQKLSKEERLALVDEDRIQTQALYGEPVIVTERKGNWAKVVLPAQSSQKDDRGYPGWIPFSQLKKITYEEWYRPEMVAINQPTTWLENEDGEKSILLSYMTCLPVERIKASSFEVITPHGKGYVPVEEVHIFPTNRGVKRGNGKKLVETGKLFLGLEYLWGGMSAYGYDCSGFTYTIHKANGYQIGRDASDQESAGKPIRIDEALPGDLLFFAYDEAKVKIQHVGIYTGDGKMLHAPSTGNGIEITPLSGTKYEHSLCSIKRYWEVRDEK